MEAKTETKTEVQALDENSREREVVLAQQQLKSADEQIAQSKEEAEAARVAGDLDLMGASLKELEVYQIVRTKTAMRIAELERAIRSDKLLGSLIASQGAAITMYKRANEAFRNLRSQRAAGDDRQESEAFDDVCAAISSLIPVEARYQDARTDWIDRELERSVEPIARQLLEELAGRRN